MTPRELFQLGLQTEIPKKRTSDCLPFDEFDQAFAGFYHYSEINAMAGTNLDCPFVKIDFRHPAREPSRHLPRLRYTRQGGREIFCNTRSAAPSSSFDTRSAQIAVYVRDLVVPSN